MLFLKNCDHKYNNIWRLHVMLLTMTMSAVCVLTEIMIIMKAIKCQFKGLYDNENLLLLVISYEIYETY